MIQRGSLLGFILFEVFSFVMISCDDSVADYNDAGIDAGGDSDSDSNTDTETATEFGCDGLEAVHCWYMGELGQSCSEVCLDHSGYSEGTKTFAGSDGIDSNCLKLIELYGLSILTFSDDPQGGAGCYWDERGYWGRDPEETIPDTKASYLRRICACNS